MNYRRIAIAFIFVDKHKKNNNPDEFKAIEKDIKQSLGLCRTSKVVATVINQILECDLLGKTWNVVESFNWKITGIPPIIALDSEEAHIIADAAEKGCGRGQCTEINGATVPSYHVKVKYPKEVRLGLGCAVDVEYDSEDLNKIVSKVGIRLKPFVYTSRLLVGIKRFEEAIAKENRRVRNLPSNYGPWIERHSNPDDFYIDDPLTKIDGLGDKTMERMKGFGIQGDLKSLIELPVDQLPQLCMILPKVRLETLARWRTEAGMKCVTGTEGYIKRPAPIDYRKELEPYKAKYGEEWKKHIMQSVTLIHLADIRDLIMHMVHETQRVGKDFFWHDALGQLTSAETREWMAGQYVMHKGITRCVYDFWLIPVKDLFYDLPINPCYRKRQPGNFWSANCWDRSLNSDTQESATCHSIITHDLPANHPAKFGRATPKALEKTFLTLLDPNTGVVPTPERIVQDFDRVFYEGLPTMIKDRGLIQGSHDGQRYKKKSTYSKNWGGKRVRKLGFDEYRKHKVHPLALEGMRVKIENSKELYNFGATNMEQPNEIIIDDLDPMDEDEENRIVAEIE